MARHVMVVCADAPVHQTLTFQQTTTTVAHAVRLSEHVHLLVSIQQRLAAPRVACPRTLRFLGWLFCRWRVKGPYAVCTTSTNSCSSSLTILLFLIHADNKCQGGSTCDSGACGCPGAPDVDLATDHSNCGRCGKQCVAAS
jgi:hypothetical protein